MTGLTRYAPAILVVAGMLAFTSGADGQITAPTELSGLTLWLDASDAATITSSGSTVTQWNDKSGNTNHATSYKTGQGPTTGANTINSLNVLNWTGQVDTSTDQRLNNSTGSVAEDDSSRTIIFVSSSFDTSSGDVVFSPGGLQHYGGGQGFAVLDTTIYGPGPYDVTGLASFGEQGNNVPQIMAVVYDNAGSGSIRKFTNGAEVGTSANKPAAGGWLTDVGYFVGGWTIALGTPNRPWDGDIGEVIVYNRALSVGSGSELASVNSYLGTKWAIPEPSSFALAALGLLSLGMSTWRRRRRA